jgi:ATP-dependent HslUV protease ATP-binding subunit HslU
MDDYIIGQSNAKKAVSTAIRSRWRRRQLPKELAMEINPKNILLVGPPGCGKTEIARRLAKLMDAPFIKVEATRFTEVGFHGRDVDQIIRDLVEVGIRQQKGILEEELRPEVQEDVNKQILTALLGSMEGTEYQSWLTHLRGGLLDERKIQVEIPEESSSSFTLQGSGGARRKQMTVREARTKLEEVALSKRITTEAIQARAIESVEQDGVVFIDEIDKIANPANSFYSGRDASSEGVQRDLLPIIEGSEISTKYGDVRTDHILFICAGAFHSVKPADLIAEFQGRLPVRVQLDPLTEADFSRILREPKNNLIKESKKMLETEGVDLVFTEEAIERIASVTWELNTYLENTGARRLHTVFEKLLEEVSFDCPEMEKGTEIVIDADFVTRTLSATMKDQQLQKYLL